MCVCVVVCCGECNLSHRFLCPSGVDQQVAFLILCNCSCHCSSHLIIRRNIYTTDTISWVQTCHVPRLSAKCSPIPCEGRRRGKQQ